MKLFCSNLDYEPGVRMCRNDRAIYCSSHDWKCMGFLIWTYSFMVSVSLVLCHFLESLPFTTSKWNYIFDTTSKYQKGQAKMKVDWHCRGCGVGGVQVISLEEISKVFIATAHYNFLDGVMTCIDHQCPERNIGVKIHAELSNVTAVD